MHLHIQVCTAQWTQITNINTEGVQYRAHVESDEQTEESRCFSEDVFMIKIRREQFSHLPVERAEVEVMISLTGWKTKMEFDNCREAVEGKNT